MNIKDEIQDLANEHASDFIEVRRHLHQNPELSFQEYQTCDYVRSQLNAIGITDIVSIAKTGLLATIHGNQNGKTILLRADMDALPMTEQNQVSYASINNGKMHACGHDVHMASLLLCAKILSRIKNKFKGTVKFLFQPGEELMPGGASMIIKEDAYLNLGTVPHIAQHVQPSLPVGKVGFRSGKFMASMDELFLSVTGKGGHAAMPENIIDPVLIASHIIVAAQQLVSRMASPQMPSVLSFGKLLAHGAINIIPNEVHIEGTFRTLDESWRQTALKKLKTLVTSIASGMGGKCELKINHGYPCLENEKDLTVSLKSLAIKYLGSDNVLDVNQWMAAEDFAYYCQINPSCFYLLGTGNEKKGIISGLHTPTFDIDESALEIGGGLMAWMAVKTLSM